MRILITGATGMVGSEVVRQALLQEEITEIVVLTRRALELQHPKLKEIIHKNFLDYRGLEETIKTCDSCIWCLGIPQAMVTAEEYHTITYSYTIAAAKAFLSVNPDISFVFVSGGGADSKEKSRILFAREKGKTENELKRIFNKNLVIARPGGINPVVKPKNVPFSYKLFYPFFPVLKLIMPNYVISSVELSQVLIYLAKNGSSQIILENKDLKRIYQEVGHRK